MYDQNLKSKQEANDIVGDISGRLPQVTVLLKELNENVATCQTLQTVVVELLTAWFKDKTEDADQ